MQKNRLIKLVEEAGVVGAGGAGFPSHLKISSKVDTVIANGAECEPLLYTDQTAMIEQTRELVAGLEMVVNITGAQKGIIALKSVYQDCIKKLKAAIKGKNGIELFLLEDFYPCGDEHVLTFEVTGRLVPQRGIPLETGVLVHNVTTLINIYHASHGQKVVDRALTVTGEVKNRGVIKVPVGTSIKEVLAQCGGPTVHPFRVICGGPMMGNEEEDLLQSVDKLTAGLIVLPANHLYFTLRGAESKKAQGYLSRATACIQCSDCTSLCPRYLLGHQIQPHILMRNITFSGPDPQKGSQALLCCQCGLCSLYACSQGHSPRTLCIQLKEMGASQNIEPPVKMVPPAVREGRNYKKVPKLNLVRALKLEKYYHPLKTIIPNENWTRVRIKMLQHFGQPAKSIVTKGEMVKKGQTIAQMASKQLGANIHASISGQVVKANRNEVVIKKVK